MNPRLNLLPEAAQKISTLAQTSADGLETGGILLGRGPSRHGLIDIIDAGDPGPDAVRRPASFRRDVAHAQTLADAAWKRYRATWIGEWHTHPHTDEEPSGCDLSTYAELLSDPTLHFSVFISIIVTTHEDSDWGRPTLTAWMIGYASVPDVLIVGRILTHHPPIGERYWRLHSAGMLAAFRRRHHRS